MINLILRYVAWRFDIAHFNFSSFENTYQNEYDREWHENVYNLIFFIKSIANSRVPNKPVN